MATWHVGFGHLCVTTNLNAMELDVYFCRQAVDDMWTLLKDSVIPHVQLGIHWEKLVKFHLISVSLRCLISFWINMQTPAAASSFCVLKGVWVGKWFDSCCCHRCCCCCCCRRRRRRHCLHRRIYHDHDHHNVFNSIICWCVFTSDTHTHTFCSLCSVFFFCCMLSLIWEVCVLKFPEHDKFVSFCRPNINLATANEISLNSC
jgi:hypothetical protein